MKIAILSVLVLSMSGCSGFAEKQSPICSGTALIGGYETKVQIYGIKKEANQTKYKAGYPFNWKWVSPNNFTNTNCKKL
ncbi:phage exclusion lipoprotein Cor [Erwinia billingiae]|uniref:phage exclusion lipoprotein Cor n=1 Tax=Erwinia billingiae TaxID=182337 RepID=UPI003D17628F